MATLTDQPSTAPDKEPQQNVQAKPRLTRLQIGTNALIQLIAVGFIVVMINYLAFNYYTRWDFSRSQQYSLADQTKRILKKLKKPARVIVFFATESPIRGDVENLLKEYQYAGKKKVEVEYVNPYRDLTRAREVVDKYNLGPAENVLVVTYDDRSKVIESSEMADYDNSPMMFGQPPQLVAFKGEQALTSALIEVQEGKQNIVYMLSGHGELDADGESLSAFRAFLERQNVKLEPLNLMNVDAIPDDAKALLAIGPKYDFSERELKLIAEFWNKNGALLVLLSPAAATPRLEQFLAAQGINPRDDRILRTVNLGTITGVLRDVTVDFAEGTPVTKRLKGINTIFLGATQSLDLNEKAAPNVQLQPLIHAAEGFWGETEFNVPEGGGVYFDPQRDHSAPLVIAASAEKGALGDARVQVDSSRMVVVGNSDFLTNEALTEPNLDFALSSINWLLDRGGLIGIAPKAAREFTLNLPDAQVTNIATVTLLIIPGIAAVIGFMAWYARRR